MRFCGNRRVSHVLNLLWGLVYALCGAIQFVAGIYFMLDLPIFQVMEDWLKGVHFSISLRFSEQRKQVRFQQTHIKGVREFLMLCYLGPLRLARHTWQCPCFSATLEATHEAR